MNKQELVAFYIAAEKRSLACANNGRAFLAEDRKTIVRAMRSLGLSRSQTAYEINRAQGKGSRHSSYAVHYGRLCTFEDQVARGAIVLGNQATGEYVGVQEVDATPFDGRIRTRADIQPAFVRAARALVKVGITTPQEASAFLVQGFEIVRSEQKIDIKAERILKELQMGDLTREQVLVLLDKVKAKF